MPDPLIRARGIVKTYGDPRRPGRRFWTAVRGHDNAAPWHRVLDGIDIEIHPGETVGVLGRNGAGKSTLLAILAGARAQTSGTVERHGRIVPILELGGSFDDNRSGRANVFEFARSYGISGAKAGRVVAEAEDFADIGDAFDQRLRTMSSGMRARVAFGAALALGGDLVMLDETLAVGDLSFRLRCYDLIRQRQEAGTAFLLVGHNPNTLANLCTRIIVLDGERIAYNGEPTGAILAYKDIRLRQSFGGASVPKVTLALTGENKFQVKSGDRLSVTLIVNPHSDIENLYVNAGIMNISGISICSTSTEGNPIRSVKFGRQYRFSLSLDCSLKSGSYTLSASASSKAAEGSIALSYVPSIATVDVKGEELGTSIGEFSFKKPILVL